MASYTVRTVDTCVLIRDWSICYELLQVHVIDISSPDKRAAAAILHACVTTGFFYGERTTGPDRQPHEQHLSNCSVAVSNHGVEQHIIENQWQQNRAFFDLPLKEKLLILADSNGRYDAATMCSQMYILSCNRCFAASKALFSAWDMHATSTLQCMLCRGYTPFSAESLDPEHQSQGDTKEGA